MAGVLGLVLLSLGARYGYHRDELYFRVAGRHLAWGYPDQPPLLPLIYRAIIGVFGDSLILLRLPAALAAAGGVLIAALTPATWAALAAPSCGPPGRTRSARS